MVSYSVHLPVDATVGDPAALDRLVVVRDGFSVFAFSFHVLWMLWHRLWLAALGLFLVLVAGAFAMDWLGLPTGAAFAIQLLVSLLIGLEASSLRRWTLRRKGLPMRDVVVADNLDEAEEKAIARWLSGAAAARSGPATWATTWASTSAPAGQPPLPSYSLPSSSSVIGLFPQPGGRA
jgi:hypothetical protein